MTRRLGEGGSGPDWRILLIGGVLLVGAIVLVAVLLFGGQASGGAIGIRQIDDGRGHVTVGAQGGPYSSVPATSGTHWDTPGQWRVYTVDAPAIEDQMVHNLEHGGVVVWYQPAQLDAAGITALENWVRQQEQTERYKVIVSPWTGQDFGHPVAVTSWDWLLYLDSADVNSVQQFFDAHYGDAPEPLGA